MEGERLVSSLGISTFDQHADQPRLSRSLTSEGRELQWKSSSTGRLINSGENGAWGVKDRTPLYEEDNMGLAESFYLLLLVLCGRVATFPLTEWTAAAAPGCATCDSLALQIQSSAAELRDAQLCEYFSFCDGDQGSLLTHDFNLPQIRSQDRCTKISFHKETCLKAIAKGLHKYNPFLLLVETSIVRSSEQIIWMRSSTQRLTELIMHQLNVEFGISTVSESEMESSALGLVSTTEWNRQVNAHVILRDFVRFMEKSARALRFMNL
ncbi:interleukin-6-like [Hemitrygon akajei]|uniref:interleukin-6-like n=1 Tax=Hemitrygon akajei TaxID=2704970 RepID=UPI003BF9C254